MFSYRSNYTVEALIQTLAFETKQKCNEWLEPFNLTFTDFNKTIIDCKNSMAALPNI